MKNDITPYIAAFERAKFQIGDRVKSRSNADGMGLIVLARHLTQSPAGFEFEYEVSGLGEFGSFHGTAAEIELEAA